MEAASGAAPAAQAASADAPLRDEEGERAAMAAPADVTIEIGGSASSRSGSRGGGGESRGGRGRARGAGDGADALAGVPSPELAAGDGLLVRLSGRGKDDQPRPISLHEASFAAQLTRAALGVKVRGRASRAGDRARPLSHVRSRPRARVPLRPARARERP